MNPVHILKKFRSRHRIEIHIDLKMDIHGDFSTIKFIQEKSGKLMDEECMLTKDVDFFLILLQNRGWIIKK